MGERVGSHRGCRLVGALLLAAALAAHATPAAASGLGLDKARALADTLAAYDAGSNGANVEIGGCKRRSANRVDCQNLRVSLASGPLSRREQQIVNLVVARHWNARYPWFAQARASLAVGIEQSVIDALDEAQPTADGKSAFARIPEDLPSGVFVLATTRPVADRTMLARRR